MQRWEVGRAALQNTWLGLVEQLEKTQGGRKDAEQTTILGWSQMARPLEGCLRSLPSDILEKGPKRGAGGAGQDIYGKTQRACRPLCLC